MDRKERPNEKYINSFITDLTNPFSSSFFLSMIFVLVAFVIFYAMNKSVSTALNFPSIDK